MLNLYILCVTVLSQYPNFSLQSTAENATFCYDDPSCGPKSAEFWPGICQTGTRQSPINLPHNINTIRESRSHPRALNFRGYKENGFFIRNNGHSIQVSFNNNLTSSSEMSGYGLDGEYVFAQAHFHWGKDIEIGGSEHTINGRHFPMEVHLVHYNKKYPSYSVASGTTTDDARALAVLAVFLEPVLLGQSSNSAFSLIANHLPDKYQTTGVPVNHEIDLAFFLPKVDDTIYRYLGSLTTPSCTQSVEWTVIPEPIPVHASDYWKFHLVRDEENQPLSQNYRPVQPLYGRNVEVFHKSL